MVYFHKVIRADIRNEKYTMEDIAIASLFLSCKITENGRRLRDVINVYLKILNPENDPLAITDKV
jgi:hypothetical protein